MSSTADRSASAGGGLLAATRQVAADVLNAARTRLELAALEIEEERLRVARLLIAASVSLFLLFVGIALVTTWTMLMVDPAWQRLVLGLCSLALLASAARLRQRDPAHAAPPTTGDTGEMT